ncbi:hypothetical protein K493DRAFT_316139 [Basidiobolus meristosporus CBS 931.73]|uniref:Exonuclease domain-containing protein n=1 Tax=Basidiobolus meristosporus CBS 931.73 TaxID=1314790 RepID=A0A1Y1Y6D3_9FUNG|nr:hypothetical protein K493DRAFT_316139 [Basidiobolus meristosporus CBS 931.73]|eukprot:ORX93144.1 hypothetical protein K493DRAFT_316139 [Basidiobolus meristosporus CBS 931.73]
MLPKVEPNETAQSENTKRKLDLVDNDGFEVQLSRTERRKLKKQKKQQEKQDDPNQYPEFYYNMAGFKSALSVKDIRDLVLWCISDGINPSWMLVKNKVNISKVVVVIIPYLSVGLPFQGIHENNIQPVPLNAIPSGICIFTHVCPTKGPTDRSRLHSPLMNFMNCPLSKSEKQRRVEEARVRAKNKSTKNPEYYMMTNVQLIDSEYPLPISISRMESLPDGWVETKPCTDTARLAEPRTIIGLDCEMCKTENGMEVTRVTLVDYGCKVIFDELVKPDNAIIDYVTHFSGITEETLKDVTTRLEDVQRRLLEIIDHHVILVGHSLNSDLNALKLVHPYIIDTAIIYTHTRGPPYKPGLKWLANKWLSRDIQKTNEPGIVGHDSAEDASTCIDLLKLKLKRGPDFGVFMVDTESIFVRLGRHQPRPKLGAVIDHKGPALIYGSDAQTQVECADDEQVVREVADKAQDHDFIWTRFKSLESLYGSSVDSSTSSTADADVKQLPLDILDPALIELSSHIENLYESLPKRTAFIVLSGHGDARRVKRLTNKKNEYSELFKTQKLSDIPADKLWTPEDEKSLIEAVDAAKNGVSFFRVK